MSSKIQKKQKAEESEDGEISSDDKEFDDGLDDDLIGDDADRARLEELTEKEREEELFKRAENRENLRKRFEIQKKLKLQAKKDKKQAAAAPSDDEDPYDDYSDAKVRAQDRQKKLDSMRFDKKSDALSQLKLKRQEKEKRDQERKEALKAEKSTRSDSDDDKRGRSRRSRSRSSSSSSRSSRRSSRSSSRSSEASGSSSDQKSPVQQKYIETAEDLEPIRLSRFKLERFVHLPFFKRLVIGCFVRIGIGQHQGRSVYRLAEVADVVETGKVYNVGKVRTNTGLRLRFGKQERVFRLEFISNQPASDSEFIKWKETIDQANMALPYCDFVRSKQHEIKKAMSYEYTSEDIDKIVAQKERFHKHPKNYAMYKSRLNREKEIATANGDEEKAKELEEKLNELEERAEELDKKRTSTISTVALINDRNRKANVSKAEEAIRNEMRRNRLEGQESNPFTRRKCNPRMVTKPSIQSSQDLLKALAAEKENQEKQKAAAAAAAAAEAKGNEPPMKKAKTEENSKEDLFDAHDFDIEIDVDTNVGPSVTNPQLNVDMKPVAAASKDSGPSKRSLNLDDYKKKRGLI